MAKQVGPVFITGTIGDICFYKMDGEYYARMKSSLTGKRVKKDRKFRRTMEYAGLMGQASKIAAGVYRLLPEDKRKHTLYRVMTGQVLRMLKDGMEPDMVKAWLHTEYLAPQNAVPAPETITKAAHRVPLAVAHRLYVTAAGSLLKRGRYHKSARLRVEEPGPMLPLINDA